MTPVDLSPLAADPEPKLVVFAKNQPEYIPLPALVYNDGRVLTEWQLTEDERAALIRGETIRLWIHLFPQKCGTCGAVTKPRLQPVSLEVTSEHKA